MERGGGVSGYGLSRVGAGTPNLLRWGVWIPNPHRTPAGNHLVSAAIKTEADCGFIVISAVTDFKEFTVKSKTVLRGG